MLNNVNKSKSSRRTPSSSAHTQASLSSPSSASSTPRATRVVTPPPLSPTSAAAAAGPKKARPHPLYNLSQASLSLPSLSYSNRTSPNGSLHVNRSLRSPPTSATLTSPLHRIRSPSSARNIPPTMSSTPQSQRPQSQRRKVTGQMSFNASSVSGPGVSASPSAAGSQESTGRLKARVNPANIATAASSMFSGVSPSATRLRQDSITPTRARSPAPTTSRSILTGSSSASRSSPIGTTTPRSSSHSLAGSSLGVPGSSRAASGAGSVSTSPTTSTVSSARGSSGGARSRFTDASAHAQITGSPAPAPLRRNSSTSCSGVPKVKAPSVVSVMSGASTPGPTTPESSVLGVNVAGPNTGNGSGSTARNGGTGTEPGSTRSRSKSTSTNSELTPTRPVPARLGVNGQGTAPFPIPTAEPTVYGGVPSPRPMLSRSPVTERSSLAQVTPSSVNETVAPSPSRPTTLPHFQQSPLSAMDELGDERGLPPPPAVSVRTPVSASQHEHSLSQPVPLLPSSLLLPGTLAHASPSPPSETGLRVTDVHPPSGALWGTAAVDLASNRSSPERPSRKLADTASPLHAAFHHILNQPAATASAPTSPVPKGLPLGVGGAASVAHSPESKPRRIYPHPLPYNPYAPPPSLPRPPTSPELRTVALPVMTPARSPDSDEHFLLFRSAVSSPMMNGHVMGPDHETASHTPAQQTSPGTPETVRAAPVYPTATKTSGEQRISGHELLNNLPKIVAHVRRASRPSLGREDDFPGPPVRRTRTETFTDDEPFSALLAHRRQLSDTVLQEVDHESGILDYDTGDQVTDMSQDDLDDVDAELDAEVDAEHAIFERKIADLEISNSSLMAINRSLEATKAKQRNEILKLRRAMRENQAFPPVIQSSGGATGAPLSRVFSSDADESFEEADGEQATDELEDEMVDPELEARWDRLAEMVTGMRKRGEEAVARGREETRPGNARVLGWLEMEERDLAAGRLQATGLDSSIMVGASVSEIGTDAGETDV